MPVVVPSHESIGCERVAEEFLREVGAGDLPNAIELARSAGLNPLPGDVERAELASDGTLLYRADARHSDQQRWVAHQLAGWLLRRASLDDAFEPSIYTGAALLLPRARFEREIEQAEWNVRALRQTYEHAAVRTIAHRIVSLREAAVTWFEHGRSVWRFVSPGVVATLEEPSRFEQHLAEISLESDEVLHPEKRVWAFPLNRNFGSTLLVCDAERLIERL